MSITVSMQSRCSRSIFRRKALALAIAGSVALAFAGGAFAQSVTGTIHGHVPVAPGESVQITGGAGYNRTITVGPSGQYSVTLPVGTYSVSLLQHGRVVQTRTGVSPVAAGAVDVNFASTSGSNKVETLSTVSVSAMAIPPIDVSTTNQVTTITAAQLQALPLARTAENIALLAPGVTSGAAELGTGETGNQLLSFGGASVAENAYYLDGFNTTDPITGQGGVTLPYGAVEEQQTFTSGYGAKYGRSIGGVISQIGKSGSNTFHFGLRAEWEPTWGQADDVNTFYNNPASQIPGEEKGDLKQYNQGNSQWQTVYDAYVSGPVIKDKLFFFVGAEWDQYHFNDVGAISSPTLNFFGKQSQPKLYAKINWNINQNNILTFTGLENNLRSWGANYIYNMNTHTSGDLANRTTTSKSKFLIGVLNYTSYITSNLTLHAMFGKEHSEFYSTHPAFPGFVPGLPVVTGASEENPAFVPPGGITNTQTLFTEGQPNHKATVTNYRVSLDYKWRNHDFSVGIDNIQTWDRNDGSIDAPPGYLWVYGQAESPSTPINPEVSATNTVPNGSEGYYAFKEVFSDPASVRVNQTAQYVQDNWQVTPNLLLNLGIRNDQFTNDNPAGQPYIRLTKPQWAPRIGFSWNVHGDSTLKVFGNAGRYYLALPAGVALRDAGAPVFTEQYFTYSGVDQNTGVPLGITEIPETPMSGSIVNSEGGQALDPRVVAASNLKAEYSDNFTLGFKQQIAHDWVVGATAVLQKMERIVDDTGEQQSICEAAVAQGFANFAAGSAYAGGAGCGPNGQGTSGFIDGSILINPGEDMHLKVDDPDGKLDPVNFTAKDQAYPRGPKRDYYSIDLNGEHVWNGKWFARADIVFSRSYGNTEGPVQSNIGQGGTSVDATEQWDQSYIMDYADGDQANDQKWQFKLYGNYAITPQWMVGANLFVGSGHPISCLGFFGPDQTDPMGYGSSYHFCGGVPTPPGSTGFTPWTHQLTVNVDYKPAWADHRLDFNLAVFNVFNEQKATQYIAGFGSTSSPSATYLSPYSFEPPRLVRFAVSYNF